MAMPGRLFGQEGHRTLFPLLEETVEYWPNGYLRSVYQHYTNARGHTVLHGSYRTYSERAQNLLWSERTFFNGQAIALRYERCGPTEDPPIVNGDFELGDFTAWRLEGARSTSIQLVPSDDPQRGLHSAKLTLHSGDIVRNGNRVELVRADSGRYQRTHIYGWSFKIPINYVEEPYWQALVPVSQPARFCRGRRLEYLPRAQTPYLHTTGRAAAV